MILLLASNACVYTDSNGASNASVPTNTESTSTEISKNESPSSFVESKSIAKRDGKAALGARKAVEQQTGKSVITSQNAAALNSVVTNMIEEVSKMADEE